MKSVVAAFGLVLWAFAGETQGLPRSHRGSDPNIWNATNTDISLHPYVASFNLDGFFMGSGAILNKHWIATSAFNVFEMRTSAIGVRVGSNFTDKGGQVLTVSRVETPVNFTRSWDWDISLVKVVETIKFNKKVKSIPLGTQPLKKGQKAVILGWGPYDGYYVPAINLQATNVTVTDPSRCERVYSGLYNDRMICTFDKHTGPADLEDEGDPMVIDGKLYGLYAGANDGYPIDRPTLYTNISKYVKWIKKTIKT